MSENIGKIEYSPDYKSKAHKAPYKLEPQKVCPDDCGVIDGLDCRGPNCPLEQPQPTPDAILSDAIDEAASIIGTYTTGAKFGADVNWYDMKKAAKSVSIVILAAVREKVESVIDKAAIEASVDIGCEIFHYVDIRLSKNDLENIERNALIHIRTRLQAILKELK